MTPHSSPAPRPTGRRVVVALLLTMATLLTATTACGSDAAKVVKITIPPGTGARIDRGEKVDVMPTTLRLGVGDHLKVTNNDTVGQDVGAWYVAAGATIEVRFGAAGRYEGLCPLSSQGRYEIVVT